MKFKFAPLVAIVLLAGCTSSAQRMYECEASGVSKDACYVAEQNRKANLNGAAQTAAFANAAAAVNGKSSTSSSEGHHHKHKRHQDTDESYNDDSNDNDQW